MNWQEVCDSPDLTNLPFKIELNQQGQILMTPVKVYHSLFQGKITGLLYQNLHDGDVLVECAIATDKGTKVADIAWATPGTLKVIRDETECSVAPEICIEVLSPANTESEMNEKKELYFSCGAEEDGDVYYKGSRIGKIEADGDVYYQGSRIGEIEPDGDVYLQGSRIGKVEKDGDVYYKGSRIGEGKGIKKEWLAGFFFFFFWDLDTTGKG